MRRHKVWVLVITTTLIAAVLYAVIPSSSSTQEPIPVRELSVPGAAAGSIEGRVLNAEGQPVAEADVFASMEARGSAPTYSTRSGADGGYRIEVGEPGTYTLSGSKEKEGYAPTLSGFHRDTSINIPAVQVGQGEMLKDIDINLGWKCSTVRGVIVDEGTDHPLAAAAITLRRADKPEILYSVSVIPGKKNGKFQVLVPHFPFTMEVSAPGYEKWAKGLSETENSVTPLMVRPGEAKEFRVSMRRQK